MANLGLDGESEGKTIFLAVHASSGAIICNHEMVGKAVEPTSENGTKTYIGIVVEGDSDYTHLVTGNGKKMFLLLCVFIDLNEDFLT